MVQALKAHLRHTQVQSPFRPPCLRSVHTHNLRPLSYALERPSLLRQCFRPMCKPGKLSIEGLSPGGIAGPVDLSRIPRRGGRLAPRAGGADRLRICIQNEPAMPVLYAFVGAGATPNAPVWE